MTREEAIGLVKSAFDAWEYNYDTGDDWSGEHNEALDMAIKALNQEPCEDAISREELLKDLYSRDYTKFTHRDFVALVQYQDFVYPKAKVGKWIESHVPESVLVECSECGFSCGAPSFNFCPMCGAKMEVGE